MSSMAPVVTFVGCPVCGRAERASLVAGWQALVERGHRIDIVGCGNPWHYVEDAPAIRPAEPGESQTPTGQRLLAAFAGYLSEAKAKGLDVEPEQRIADAVRRDLPAIEREARTDLIAAMEALELHHRLDSIGHRGDCEMANESAVTALRKARQDAR